MRTGGADTGWQRIEIPPTLLSDHLCSPGCRMTGFECRL